MPARMIAALPARDRGERGNDRPGARQRPAVSRFAPHPWHSRRERAGNACLAACHEDARRDLCNSAAGNYRQDRRRWRFVICSTGHSAGAGSAADAAQRCSIPWNGSSRWETAERRSRTGASRWATRGCRIAAASAHRGVRSLPAVPLAVPPSPGSSIARKFLLKLDRASSIIQFNTEGTMSSHQHLR
jgi:hypothetical protein